jgi:hypothetical protein
MLNIYNFLNPSGFSLTDTGLTIWSNQMLTEHHNKMCYHFIQLNLYAEPFKNIYVSYLIQYNYKKNYLCDVV